MKEKKILKLGEEGHLHELQKGQSAIVTGLHGDNLAVKRRLLDMGITTGVTVKVKKSGLSGKVKWTVSKGSKIVKLSKKTGNIIKVTCRKKGKAVIKASCGKYSAKVTIKIK